MNALRNDSSLIHRRQFLGVVGAAGILALSARYPALADHGPEVESARSDPWLAVNPHDGALYLSWVSPEHLTADHAEHEDAAPEAEAAGEENHHAETVNRVYVARSTDHGATFGEAVLVSGEDPYVSIGATAPVSGFGPDGAIYVAYLSATPSDVSEYGREIVMVARSDDGTSFAPAIEVPQDEGIINAGGYHDLIVDHEGRVFVAWLDFRDPFNLNTGNYNTSAMRVTWSDDRAQTFAPSVEVSKPACPCCPPRFQLGTDGELLLAWRNQEDQSDGSDPVRDPIVAWSADRGETWSAPELIHHDGWHMPQCPHSGPGYGVGADGRQHVAWFTGAEGRNGVFYAVADALGEAFSEPIALFQDEWVPVTPVRLALDDQGNAYVAYVDAREETPLVLVNQIAPDGTVSGINPADLSGVYPTIAVGGDVLSLGYIGDHDVQVDAISLSGESAGA